MTIAVDTPVSRTALDAMLRPRRIAMIGASDKNLFSRRAFAQHQRMAGSKPLALVNPRNTVVHGVNAFSSSADVPGGIDCAFLLTPQSATAAALTEAVAAGARAAVVLSQGWAEEGEAGAQQQRALVALAHELGVVLLGPNHLGFANLWDGVAPCALGLDMPVEPGHLALVTQSGAVGSSMVGYAARQGVHFSFVVTTGNEAMVSIADVVDYLVDDEKTKAIAVFAEMIRKPDLFRSAARRAADRGKPIIILKAGSSELAAQTAAAHTGALVGDDRVIEAVLRQDGVIRVRSLEDLICTASLATSTGPLRAPGVAVLSVSGGACDLIADRGADVGLELPELSDRTVAKIAEFLPPYAHPQNPLDVTGGALTDPTVWQRGVELVAAEPQIGLVGIVTSLPTSGQPQREETFHAVGRALASSGIPGVIFPQLDQAQSDHVREVQQASGVHNVLPGVDRFVAAAAGVGRWSKWLTERRPYPTAPAEQASAVLPAQGSVNEWEGRALLEQAGVPVVPAVLTMDGDEAVEAARGIDTSVVLKLCSREVAHKTEIGGVELDVRGDEQVRLSFDRIVERAGEAGVAFEGVLVSPMRRGGVELLVGVQRDPDWGQVLAVALGGIFVELLDDSAIRVLPVDAQDVRGMLTDLRGSALLDGFRGSEPVDLDRLASVIAAFAGLAVRLGPEIDAMEINPLRVDGDEVEALDVLISPSTDT